MAEILLLARDHWSDIAGEGKPDGWSQEKYDSRQRIGDVIRVVPDGYYRIESLEEGLHGWNRKAFVVVRVPFLTVQQLESAIIGDLNDDDRKFHYNVDWSTFETELSTNDVTINDVTTTEKWLHIPNRGQLQKLKIINKITDIEVPL